jgi:hypothetical protein
MPRPNAGARVAAARDAAVVLGILLVLGVLAGVLWSQVVTPAEFTKLATGGEMGEDQLGRQFGADGWYVVIALVTGLAAGAVLSWWRSTSVAVTTGALLLGAVLAAVAMAVVGHVLGPPDPQHALAAAKVGATVPEALDVGTVPVWPLTDYLQDTLAVYLTWPVGVLLGVLLVIVGRRPEEDPVSGSDDGHPGSSRAPGLGDSGLMPGTSR